jgi:hypothetical protein
MTNPSLAYKNKESGPLVASFGDTRKRLNFGPDYKEYRTKIEDLASNGDGLTPPNLEYKTG